MLGDGEHFSHETPIALSNRDQVAFFHIRRGPCGVAIHSDPSFITELIGDGAALHEATELEEFVEPHGPVSYFVGVSPRLMVAWVFTSFSQAVKSPSCFFERSWRRICSRTCSSLLG